jgi:hypothetical protein
MGTLTYDQLRHYVVLWVGVSLGMCTGILFPKVTAPFDRLWAWLRKDPR